jgi:hypothetical protein
MTFSGAKVSTGRWNTASLLERALMLLTPWNWAVLEKPPVAQLLKTILWWRVFDREIGTQTGTSPRRQKQPPKHRTPVPHWHSWEPEMTSLYTVTVNAANHTFPCDRVEDILVGNAWDSTRYSAASNQTRIGKSLASIWAFQFLPVRHMWNGNILPGGKAGKNKRCFRATWTNYVI